MKKLKKLKKLDDLVNNGTIKSYTIDNVDENGNVGSKSQFRNTEQLTIDFPNGEKLIIGTLCSGCSENTVLT